MADSEFEEFRHIFERHPQNSKTSTPFYSLVPNVGLDEDSPTSSKSGSSCGGDVRGPSQNGPPNLLEAHTRTSSGEDDEDDDGIRLNRVGGGRGTPNLGWTTNGERRRRKLPEIPKNKKSSVMTLCGQPASLAEELGALAGPLSRPGCQGRPLLVLKCGYLLDEDSSPDSERLHSLGDVDSGHSTAHSPTDTGPKSISPTPMQIMHTGSLSPSSSCSTTGVPFPTPSGGGISFSQLEMLEATHRGLHKFIPRHHGEIELEIGDPLYVQKEAEDLWCEGVNLRTGRQGIFPSAYAVDMDYNDFDPTNVQVKRERYLLGYLGSVETLAHKGTGVVCQAVKKLLATPEASHAPKPAFWKSLTKDFEWWIDRNLGRAFQRFYQKFIETAYPIEDIYLE